MNNNAHFMSRFTRLSLISWPVFLLRWKIALDIVQENGGMSYEEPDKAGSNDDIRDD